MRAHANASGTHRAAAAHAIRLSPHLGIEGARTNNVTQRARAAPLRRSRRPRLQLLADLRDGAMAARGGRRATLGAVEWRRGEQVRRADHRGGRARAHDGSLGRAAERLGDA